MRAHSEPPSSHGPLSYKRDAGCGGGGCGGGSKSRCVYRLRPAAKSPTVCDEVETSRLRVVSSPSTPTGPRAWMRLVEMPTCKG